MFIFIFNYYVILFAQFFSYVARALSLGLRLTANMIDINVVLKLFCSFMLCCLVMLFTSILLPDHTFLFDIHYSYFVPIMIYNNADISKSTIIAENKEKSGIYMWTHIASGRIYIGSAIDLSKRLYRYYSVSMLKVDDNYICRALLHYNHSAFSLSILDYIDISGLSKKEARSLILKSEQFYLDIIFSLDVPYTYNVLKIAGNSLGYIHSEETLAKMSKALSGENNPRYGITSFTHTADTIAKMSEAHKGKTISAETRALISAVKGTAIYVYDLEDRLVNSFPSARKTALHFGVSSDTILKYVRNSTIFQERWKLSTSPVGQ